VATIYAAAFGLLGYVGYHGIDLLGHTLAVEQ